MLKVTYEGTQEAGTLKGTPSSMYDCTFWQKQVTASVVSYVHNKAPSDVWLGS